jgi:glutaryl-CoA dehydrogenase
MEQKCGFQMPLCRYRRRLGKNEEGRIHGLIVERGMEGFTTPETHNKWSLRASSTGELIFDNGTKENLLPNKSGLTTCLDSARWNRLGSYWCCYGLL